MCGYPGSMRRRGILDDRTTFVGRAKELAAIQALLVSGVRLVTIHGPPGVGKSRVLREVARLDEGATMFDLSSAKSAADGHAALGDPAALGRGLVVLDDADGISAVADDTLGQWLRAAPEATFVVGSRTSVRISGEAIVRIEPLGDEEAVALLTDRARKASGDPGWGGDRQVLVRLVRALDGLPLAIELASERAAALSPAAILDALRDRLRFLRTKRRDATSRSQSMEASLDVSWEPLSEAEREALSGMAVFSGGFSLEGVQSVLTTEDALDLLEALVDRSLVQRQAGETPRFALLGCVRERALLEAKVAWPELGRRHSAFFFRLAAGLRSTASVLAPSGAIGDLSLDIENVLAAHERALSIDPVSAARALLDLEPTLAQKRPLGDISALLERATEHVTSPTVKVRLLVANARTLQRMGRADAATSRLEAARAVAAEEGDPSLAEAVLAAGSGTPAGLGGRPLRVEASTEIFDAVTVAGASGAGALELARRACERTLATLRRRGSRRSEGVVLTRLASVLLRADEPEDALSVADEAWAIHHELGAALFEGVSAYVAGLAEARLGEIGRAAERFADVHARADEIDSPLLRGYARHGEGVLAAAVGDVTLAMAELEAAVIDLASGGDPVTSAEAAELSQKLASRASPGASSAVATPPSGPALRVAPTWFELEGHPRVDLSRRRALRLFLRRLAEHAVARPGTALALPALVLAAWPGERILAMAASARVWTAVRTLRELGLRDVVVTQDDGYTIASGVSVELAT